MSGRLSQLSGKDFGETVNLDEAFSKVTKMLDKIEIQRTQEQEKGFEFWAMVYIEEPNYSKLSNNVEVVLLKVVRFV